MMTDLIGAGERIGMVGTTDESAGLRELDPAELEGVEGGFLFLAGFAAGVVLGVAIGVAISR